MAQIVRAELNMVNLAPKVIEHQIEAGLFGPLQLTLTSQLEQQPQTQIPDRLTTNPSEAVID